MSDILITSTDVIKALVMVQRFHAAVTVVKPEYEEYYNSLRAILVDAALRLQAEELFGCDCHVHRTRTVH